MRIIHLRSLVLWNQLPECKEGNVMLLYDLQLCRPLLENRTMTREDERLFGRASRLLCTCWGTEKIREMVSKFIMVFLIKYTHMPKQRCFCLSLPDRVLGRGPSSGSCFLYWTYWTINRCHSPLTMLGVFPTVLRFLPKMSTGQPSERGHAKTYVSQFRVLEFFVY